MEWVKEIAPKGGDNGGWRGDFPLDHNLPEIVKVDCSRLTLPIHPMFAVRLRIFIDWHRSKDRQVVFVPPSDPFTRRVVAAMKIDPIAEPGEEADTIMAVTAISQDQEVEDVAERTREILEYQLHDVSPLGEAVFMAVSEFCGNAIDHGRSSLGAYAAIRRVAKPKRKVSIAIGDLGVGIPEHIRQRFPEWSDDGWAIAHATEDHVSGTDDPHRGIGFSAVFEAALTDALHAAQLDILSANGHCRIQTVQENRKIEVFPAARFRRGTWISYELVSV